MLVVRHCVTVVNKTMSIIAIQYFRRRLTSERVFRDRKNPLDFLNDEDLYKAFRFHRNELLALCDELSADIEYISNRRGALLPVMQLLIALRFYATGTFQAVIGEMFGVNQSTASRTVNRVTKAILLQMPRWVHLPTQVEADEQKVKFHAKAGFPGVIGCVDGTHIRIQAPSQNEHTYVNRKNYHSINVQVGQISFKCFSQGLTYQISSGREGVHFILWGQKFIVTHHFHYFI